MLNYSIFLHSSKVCRIFATVKEINNLKQIDYED